jgi:Rod binding domain-containing protein
MSASEPGGHLMNSLSSGATGLADLFAVHSPARQVPEPDSTPQTRKLYKECQQFEGLLIANLWSEMSEGDSMTGLDSEPGDATMQGLGIQSAANSIAMDGGMGIARMLYDAVVQRLPAERRH